MTTLSTIRLPADWDALAPDGSEVRILCATTAGSMAHFQLPAGETSRAVRHRTVEEIWYVLSGEGEMWRSGHGSDSLTPLSAGTCLTIPVGIAFQFRATGGQPLKAVAVTMPPWPGDDEAEIVGGRWIQTEPPGGPVA